MNHFRLYCNLIVTLEIKPLRISWDSECVFDTCNFWNVWKSEQWLATEMGGSTFIQRLPSSVPVFPCSTRGGTTEYMHHTLWPPSRVHHLISHLNQALKPQYKTGVKNIWHSECTATEPSVGHDRSRASDTSAADDTHYADTQQKVIIKDGRAQAYSHNEEDISFTAVRVRGATFCSPIGRAADFKIKCP